MSTKIVLIGKEEKNFRFIREALSTRDYHYQYFNLEKVKSSITSISNADLIIVDTAPFSESDFSQFYILRENEQLAQRPVLALVNKKPVRLRYRLIDMRLDDYITIPFDRLDLQIRVRNLLHQKPGMRPEVKSTDAFVATRHSCIQVLHTINAIYQNISQIKLNADNDNLFNYILGVVRKTVNAAYVLQFKVGENEQLYLTYGAPSKFFNEKWRLPVSKSPMLEKAVRLQKPTILNNIASDNKFVNYLNSMLNTKTKSIIVYPIFPQHNTHSILMVLKTDGEQYTDFHYEFTQIIAHLITHIIDLKVLKSDIKEKHNSQIWKFYYDYLAQIVNQLSFGILVIGEDLRIKYLNENAATLLRISANEVLQQPLANVVGDEAVRKIVSSREVTSLTFERPELELDKSNGEKLLVGYSVQDFWDHLNEETGFIISLKDITDSKEIQEEMRRVDRLASLGVMASGIAHEIRNPLAGIKAMIQTFEDELDETDNKNEYIQRILRLVNRLDELLRTLFSYASPPKPNRQYCDIEAILKDVLSLLRQKIRANGIDLSEMIHPDLPKVYVDAGQIQQVLMNLLLNSIEAISGEGKIEISIQPFNLDNQLLDNGRPPFLALIKSKPFIKIHIKDNGCGIAEENLKHIYNPFFTTKTFGTGLGLSIVYQIVKENDGLISFKSHVNEGTDCYLYLPVEMELVNQDPAVNK